MAKSKKNSDGLFLLLGFGVVAASYFIGKGRAQDQGYSTSKFLASIYGVPHEHPGDFSYQEPAQKFLEPIRPQTELDKVVLDKYGDPV